MKRSEFTQLFMGDNFHMDNSTHSMTHEEVVKKFEEDTIKAKEGARILIRQLIIESLKAKGIDPSTVDIDKIIEENYPEVKKNEEIKEFESSDANDKIPEDADINAILYNDDITYFRTNDDIILKLIRAANRGYTLVEKDGKKCWRERPGIIARYEYGEFSGYVIKKGYFEDTYENETDISLKNDTPSLEKNEGRTR